MEWDGWVGLWYLDVLVTVAETAGVEVNLDYGKMEFIYQNQGGYEPTQVAGGRLNAYRSLTFRIVVGTEYGYDKVKFSTRGTDDNGYDVRADRTVNLHYVD